MKSIFCSLADSIAIRCFIIGDKGKRCFMIQNVHHLVLCCNPVGVCHKNWEFKIEVPIKWQCVQNNKASDWLSWWSNNVLKTEGCNSPFVATNLFWICIFRSVNNQTECHWCPCIVWNIRWWPQCSQVGQKSQIVPDIPASCNCAWNMGHQTASTSAVVSANSLALCLLSFFLGHFSFGISTGNLRSPKKKS